MRPTLAPDFWPPPLLRGTLTRDPVDDQKLLTVAASPSRLRANEDAMDSKHSVLLCTVPDAETGVTVARSLVDERLAACVNIVPGLRSIYSWKGQTCDEAEALLVIKTRTVRIREVTSRVTELHPYDVPEVIALPIVAGHAPYLSWIDDNVR